MFERQTKTIEQNYSWSYQLIQQRTVATNWSLGLFVRPKFCLWLVSLSENRNLLFPFSAVYFLYAIQKKMPSEQKLSAPAQCLLVKMKTFADTEKSFSV